MKAYIVASHVAFTTICMARNAESAVKKAARISMKKYGFIVDGLTAYEAKDYLTDEPDGLEIDIL